MDAITIYWLVFISIFLIVYAIDLSVTSHEKGPVSLKASLGWVSVWITKKSHEH
jgi:tellurite resistance protein TerC